MLKGGQYSPLATVYNLIAVKLPHHQKGTDSMDSSAWLAILVIMVFAGIVALMIRTAKKTREEKADRAQTLGFTPLEDLPPVLIGRLEDLYRGRKNLSLEVRNLFHRREFDRDLYLFDLEDTNDDDTSLGMDMLGVISRNLALPQFSLISVPPLDRSKPLGGLMEKMLDKVLYLAGKYQGLTRVDFPEQPGFEERFVVFGRDPYAVQNLLSGSIASFLQSQQLPLQVAGIGDFLTVEFGYSTSPSGQEKDLRQLYQIFQDLVGIFEEAR
jgi:hypothetical protein